MFMESDAKRRIIRIAVWVAVVGMVIGVLSSLVAATGASAHAALKSSSPRDGASLSAAPTEVALTFSEEVSTSFATVSVTSAAGRSVGRDTPAVSGATVTQPLDVGLASGAYMVSFRVVSKDGHPVSGRTSFSLALDATGGPSATTSSAPDATTPPGAAASSPAPTQTETSTAAGTSEPGGARPGRLALAVGVGALALAAGTALVAAARRRDQL